MSSSETNYLGSSCSFHLKTEDFNFMVNTSQCLQKLYCLCGEELLLYSYCDFAQYLIALTIHLSELNMLGHKGYCTEYRYSCSFGNTTITTINLITLVEGIIGCLSRWINASIFKYIIVLNNYLSPEANNLIIQQYF